MVISNLWRTVGMVGVSSLGVLILGGCSTTPTPVLKADYTQSLDRYYQGRPSCVWPDAVQFPVKNAAPDLVDERGLNALAEAGLLTEIPPSKGGARSFELTAEGRAALDRDVFDKNAGNFCYGRRTVSGIDEIRRNTSSTNIVDYRYAMTNPASWALQPVVQSAFPQIAQELKTPHQAEATMVDTTDGWEISSAPTMIVPQSPAEHTSMLAKATAMILPRHRSGS
jgi:hypothetical protein